MVLFNLLIFILTLNEVIIHLDATLCDIGQRVEDSKGTRCVPCQDGFFQPERKFSKICLVCTPCDEERGSVVQEECTKIKNTVCGCREGFVSLASDSSICMCDVGSGLENGVCSRCKEGYFSTDTDTKCQKWKDCKSAGIKKAGNTTTDVVCNEKLNGSQTTISPTTIKKVFPSLSSTRRPHEGVQTQKTLSSTTTTPVQHPSMKNTAQPSSPSSNTSTHIGTAILIFGIAGLLGLTAMTCKLHFTPCWHPKPAVQTKDSLCRRPVEEIGDGSECSLKLNPEP